MGYSSCDVMHWVTRAMPAAAVLCLLSIPASASPEEAAEKAGLSAGGSVSAGAAASAVEGTGQAEANAGAAVEEGTNDEGEKNEGGAESMGAETASPPSGPAAREPEARTASTGPEESASQASGGIPAKSGEEEGERTVFYYGFSMGLGVTTTLGSYWRDENLELLWGSDARKGVAFAFTISLDFDIWLTERWAIFFGAGIARKGTRIKDWEATDGVTWEGLTESILYGELPFGVKLRISGWQLGFGIAAYFGIRGSTTTDDGDTTDRTSWPGGKWDEYLRFNFGPKFLVGYAFTVDRITSVPSLEWNMHMLSDIRDVPAGLDPRYDQSRYMTILLKLGVYFF